YYSIAPHSI
nr:Chain P, 9-mer peptide from Spike protein [Middle East respiratory syndrome-related coronavirus]5GSR_Q Chain Q, 9-mer peptide from Spike protein [Middle East respiratory syndrome-related coronavirus]